MHRRKTILLIMLLIIAGTAAAYAQTGLIIREIIVVGTTRTHHRVITSQLPFREGDIWQEDFSLLAVRRLTALDIFSYEPMRVTAEQIFEHECRVIIRIADPFLLFKDPAEFTIMSGMNLAGSQVNLTVYNPFGTGQNLSAEITWGENYSYRGIVSSPLGPGKLSLSGRSYRGNYSFWDGSLYESSGWSVELTYWYWWNRHLRQSARIQYHAYELDHERASLIIANIGILYDDSFTALVTSSAGMSLQDQPPFLRIQAAVSRQFGPFITLARGGHASGNTPDTHRFILGGFNDLPLRGEDSLYLASSYVIGTGEFHIPLERRITPIVFLDGGWLSHSDNAAGYQQQLINIGAGLALYTPLGIPVRLDTAINPLTQSWGGVRVGFGHSYAPLL